MSDLPADILIIDDERQIRRLLNLTLTGAGYHVRECENGRTPLFWTWAFRTSTVWKCSNSSGNGRRFPF